MKKIQEENGGQWDLSERGEDSREGGIFRD